MIATFEYRLVDVFTDRPFRGNGLTVFDVDATVPTALLHDLTREVRQFESIFLSATTAPDVVAARIFTMDEELPFAGHPIIGAACVLHERRHAAAAQRQWRFRLGARDVAVTSICRAGRYSAEMDQGVARFRAPLHRDAQHDVIDALGIDAGDLATDLPMQVVSTGLDYLIVPLRGGLDDARIRVADFGARLARVHAQFVYVLDVGRREGRTWDNAGGVEDAATGSAAGPAAAYLVRHAHARAGETLVLQQGRHVGRPSRLLARVESQGDALTVHVGGDVAMVGRGTIAIDADFAMTSVDA
jgi:trans-2,3-dihydro-3-hydroxyanthranilate isomerase